MSVSRQRKKREQETKKEKKSEENMKVLIVASLCITFALACENLGKLEACNRPEGDCSCQAGLSCVLTKKMILDGSVTPVKQCMPEDAVISVETIDLNNKQLTIPALRAKRSSGMYTKCSSQGDCDPNFCCPNSVKLCIPKIGEYNQCNSDVLYPCDCQEGLVCQKTADITLGSGSTVPLKQCIKKVNQRIS